MDAQILRVTARKEGGRHDSDDHHDQLVFATRLAMHAAKVLANHCLIDAITTAGREALKWLLIVAAVSVGHAHMAAWPALAAERSEAALAPAPVGDLGEEITRMFVLVTSNAKKPLPVWLLDTAVHIYTAYRTYKNGEKVEEAARIAHTALNEIAHVRTEIEVGRHYREKEQRLIRARLEAQANLLEGLGRRVQRVELTIEREMNNVAYLMKLVTRRGCQKFQAFDRPHTTQNAPRTLLGEDH